MPTIVRFYIIQCVIGFIIAALFTATLLWFDVANLWQLISRSDVGLMAVVVFWVLNGIVFAGVQCGVAVMLMTQKDDKDETPHGGQAVPVRVAATRREIGGR